MDTTQALLLATTQSQGVGSLTSSFNITFRPEDMLSSLLLQPASTRYVPVLILSTTPQPLPKVTLQVRLPQSEQ